jgi:hypothetical protein
LPRRRPRRSNLRCNASVLRSLLIYVAEEVKAYLSG